MNRWDEFWIAWKDAKDTIRMADAVASQIGTVLVGRLKQCDCGVLCALKRELRDFNIGTRKWRA